MSTAPAIAASHATLAANSRSFSLAARLLPPSCRDAIAVLYAWCRRVDDAIDRVPPSARAGALAQLRAELDAVYAGTPQEPTAAAFAAVVRAFGIPRAYPAGLLEGMAMDVARTRYATLEELLHYCHCVAGTVGLMLCHVMGVSDPGALRRAAHLGIAMQLTNICRDVAEDLEDGRVYLPASLLRCELSSEAALDGQTRAAVAQTVTRLLAEADRFYRSGDEGLQALPWRCALAVRAARLLYAAIGTRLREREADPFQGRAVVPRGRQLRLVLLAAVQSAGEMPTRLRHGHRAVAPDRVLVFPDDVLPL
jgi:phytoene synthase